MSPSLYISDRYIQLSYLLYECVYWYCMLTVKTLIHQPVVLNRKQATEPVNNNAHIYYYYFR